VSAPSIAERVFSSNASADGFAGLLDQKREDGKTNYSTIAFQKPKAVLYLNPSRRIEPDRRRTQEKGRTANRSGFPYLNRS
jgi:hypothetical protein